jgi:tetratricopeptide (TPR) repeat protein
LWECENCEERFSGGVPESGIRRLDDKATRPKAIFFSYGHDENRDLVRLFKNDLEKRGHQIWFDEKDIGEWDDWKGKITRGIDSSQLAIAFMSKHSIRDPGVCRNEIAIAMNRFGAVYPVLLEANIEQDIPITIRHLQWPDLSQWQTIRDGKVPGIEWDRWYEERLLSLIEKIEGDATQFADETGVLERILNPITTESKIVQHLPSFVGREWIFDAYREWVDQKTDSRLFWIKAGPGVGKSAIAANLIHRERSAIVAGWFCDAKSGERKDPNRAIRSIAFQLALRWEDYRVRLLRKLQVFSNTSEELCEEARKELEKKNTHDLFTSLLAEPMTGLIWRDHKLVVVIDALDEAVDDEGNNRITELISNELNSLPPWIGFVVTSRPEADIVNQLQGFKPYELNTADPRNVADLKTWYNQHLGRREEIQALAVLEQQQIEKMLIDRSGGMILYLKVIEEGFREGSLTVAKLGELESGLPGLYRRYYDSFSKRFQKDYEEEIKPLLRLLLAAGGPLPEDLACETLGWNSEQFIVCRNRLGSYVIENTKGYELFHKTLAEWLSDKSSGSFYLDRSVGRQLLADVLFTELSEKETHLVRWKELISDWLPEWLPKLSQSNNSSLINDLGNFFREMGNYALAEPLLHQALAISEKMGGPEHPSTGTRLDSLGLLVMDKGDYEGAEPLLRRALAIFEKMKGPEHPSTGNSLDSLGSLLRHKGDYGGAELLYRGALAISEKMEGPEHPTTGIRLNNLGLLLSDKGDYEGAEPLLRRALAISEKLEGPEHSSTGAPLNNLGTLLSDKGDYEGAEPLLRRALAISEKMKGPEHPSTGTILNNLGKLLSDKGDYKGAESLLRRALAISEKMEGPEHPSTGISLYTLGALLKDKGDYEGAEPLLRRALAISEKMEGPEHPSTGIGLYILGALLKDKGDYEGAEPLLRRSLAISEKMEGPEHPSTGISLNILGALLSDKGDYEGAEPLLRRALAISENMEVPEHPKTRTRLNNLGLLLSDKGDYEGAEPLLRRVLAISEKMEGPEHPNTGTCLNNLGLLLSYKGDYEGAEPLLRRALAISEKMEGPEHPSTGTRLNNLGALLSDKGDYEGAEPLLRRALVIYEKVGLNQEEVLSSMQNLAVAIRDTGDLEKAESLLLKVIEGFIRLEGIDCLNVASTYSAMGKLMSLKDNIDEAKKYYRKALDIRQAQLGENHELTILVRSRLKELLGEKSPQINLEKEKKK